MAQIFKKENETEQKPKSLRQKLSTSQLAKGGEVGEPALGPGFGTQAMGKAVENIRAGQVMPDKSLQAKSLPTEEEPDENDQAVANYIQESQTLEGPESGKVSPDKVPGPDAFASFYRKWKSVPTTLNAEDRKMFTDKLAQLDEKMIEAEQLYLDQKNRLEWAEVAEQLGHAIVQLFAAQDAAKNNWSIGGMRFDKNNWESRFDRAMREFDSKKDTLSKQQAAVTRELERAEGKAERAGTAEQKLLERDFFTTQAKIEAQARRSAKEDEAALKDTASKERAAREKARMYIANYEAAEDAVNKLEAKEYKDDKEKQALKDEIVDALRKNGHIGVSKDLAEGGKGAPGKKGGIFGFFQSDDYSTMKNYISANKKNGIKSVYRGYGVEVPADVNQALAGTEEAATQEQAAASSQQQGPNEVERITADGRTAIFDANTKKFLRFK